VTRASGRRLQQVDPAPGDVIDIWDVATLDGELTSALGENADLICSYWSENARLFREREAQTVRGPPEENRFSNAYQELKERVGKLMESRTIRAWHYTRLTDAEVARIRTDGIQPMTLAMIRERLDAAVVDGAMDSTAANALFDASPYHRQIDGNRQDKTWFAAEPFSVASSDVEELLATWGGESIGWAHRSGPTRDLLMGIGRPRVLEVELPLLSSTRVYEAGCAVIDAYSLQLGCSGAWPPGADIVVVEPVLPEWIVDVHSEGDEAYRLMGRGYPSAYVNREN